MNGVQSVNESDMVDELFEDAESKETKGNQLMELHKRAISWTLDDELKRSTEISAESVEELRDWVAENQSNLGIDLNDRQLVSFVHSCNGDVERAKTVVKTFCSIRRTTPEVFSDRALDSQEIRGAFDMGYFIILPNKTPEGYRIVLQGLRDADPDKFVHATSCKAQLLAMDAAVVADPTAAGYAFVCDMTGFQMAHMYKQGFSLSRKIFKYTQEGQPIRIRKLCLLNASSLISKMMALIKVFLQKELYDMIEIYTPQKMEDLYKSIPRDCLPKEYGGTLESVETLHEYTIQWLKQMERDSFIPS